MKIIYKLLHVHFMVATLELEVCQIPFHHVLHQKAKSKTE